MKLLDIQPYLLNEELARKICRNKSLKKDYILLENDNEFYYPCKNKKEWDKIF